jgi:hypothetical protein
MPPTLFGSLFLLCQFELKRLFTTRKGLLHVVTFAVVWYFILLYPIRYASDWLGQQQHSGGFFDMIGFGSLMNWNIPEFGVYWRVALLIFPILSVIITADQTCSDRERGTLRFLALRASRNELFFGRFIGVMVVQIILIITTLATTLVLTIYRDSALLTEALNNSVAITVNLIFVLLPFTAMMAALSISVKSVRQSSTWAILIWTCLAGIVSTLSSYVPALSILQFLIPGYQMAELAQLSQWQPLQLAYIPFAQAMLLLGLGRWIMSRKNL